MLTHTGVSSRACIPQKQAHTLTATVSSLSHQFLGAHYRLHVGMYTLRRAHGIEGIRFRNRNRMRFVHFSPYILQVFVDNSHHIGNLRADTFRRVRKKTGRVVLNPRPVSNWTHYTCGFISVNGTFPGLLPGRPAGGDRPGVNGAGWKVADGVADKSAFLCPGALKKLSKNDNSA